MKTKTIGIIFGMILMISLASAINIIAGNNYSFESEEFEYWTVTGNSSNMEGMNITWNNGNTTISFDIRYKPDNFTLVFFNLEEKIIKEYHYRGGGTRKVYIENKTIVKVDNYVDREIYITNDTEIQRLNDELKKIQEDLNKKNERITFLLFGFLISLCSFLFLLTYTLRKSIKKFMDKLNIF